MRCAFRHRNNTACDLLRIFSNEVGLAFAVRKLQLRHEMKTMCKLDSVTFICVAILGADLVGKRFA